MKSSAVYLQAAWTEQLRTGDTDQTWSSMVEYMDVLPLSL